MNKCLRISFGGSIPEGFIRNFIQKNAKKLSLEGTVQIAATDQVVKIIVCGPKDVVDSFLDLIYKKSSSIDLDSFLVEPFFKEKDYRGVFRVIE